MALINTNSNNKITCASDMVSTIKSFVFGGDPANPTMEIVQGAKTLLAVSLSELFITLDKYQLQEFVIDSESAITLDGNNIASSIGEVQFLAVLVDYPLTDVGNATIDTDELYINWEFPTGGDVRRIGKIMILTGSVLEGYGWDLDMSPGGMTLHNPHESFAVTVKILAFS